MIFVKLAVDSFGSDPVLAYSNFINDLVQRHTQNIFESYQEALLTIQYPDSKQYQLDDQVSRYADNELSFYSLEEKIDPSYYVVALNGRTSEGIERVNNILDDIRRHESYRGRLMNHRIVAIVSDEPQCIPCMKKKLKRISDYGTPRKK